MYNRVAVIGLGGFGTYLVKELASQGYTVLAIDKDQDNVDNIQNYIYRAFILNACSEEGLNEIDWDEVDIAVVAIGDNNLESSIMTVTLLREFGVPRIIARSGNDIHEKILKQVGAHEIINPEKDIAKIMVDRISYPNIFNLQILDENTVITEFIPPASFIDKDLQQLELHKKYNITIIAIRRIEQGKPIKTRLIINPETHEKIMEKDILTVLGDKGDIQKITNLG